MCLINLGFHFTFSTYWMCDFEKLLHPQILNQQNGSLFTSKVLVRIKWDNVTKGLALHLRHTDSCFMNMEWLKCQSSERLYHYSYYPRSFVHWCLPGHIQFCQVLKPFTFRFLSFREESFYRFHFFRQPKFLGSWCIKCYSVKYSAPITGLACHPTWHNDMNPGFSEFS